LERLAIHDQESANQRLWLAVMETAIADWTYGPVRRKRDAEYFLFEDKEDFSFVCRSAGLSPNCVREKLQAMHAKPIRTRFQHAAPSERSSVSHVSESCR
jgi:hypothetical protein